MRPMSAPRLSRPRPAIPCLSRHEGPGDLRACDAGNASATSANSSSPIRRDARTSWPSWSASGVALAKDDPRVNRLLEEVKEKESLGYAYEGAEASFELLVRRVLGEVPDYFDIERFSVNVERRHNAQGDLATVSEAVVKLRVHDEILLSAAEGIGPVNALDPRAAQGSRPLSAVSSRMSNLSITGCASSRAAPMR